jgi:hypothetical protein
MQLIKMLMLPGNALVGGKRPNHMMTALVRQHRHFVPLYSKLVPLKHRSWTKFDGSQDGCTACQEIERSRHV